jgi:hypothetical protein
MIGEVDANETSKLQNLIEVQNAGLKLRPGKEKNKWELYSNQIRFTITREKEGRKVPFDELSDITVYFRSPHAMLYYLGEIMRVENRTENQYIPMIDVSHDPSVKSLARLFYARKATDEDTTPCVSVDYEGIRYVIPGDTDGKGKDRSMQVLALVSQLIGLQKTSEEAPATGVVSVIGR